MKALEGADYLARRRASRIAVTVASGCAVAALLPLAALVLDVVVHGLSALSTAFFTELPRPPFEPGGGVANAIVGTLELVGLAAAAAVPVGVAAGLWLSEYRHARLSSIVRYAAYVLGGIPSIVVGVVVYALVVVRMKHFSVLAGALSLAVLMLPIVVRTTDELARQVPESLREAALALGAPRWRIATSVVLKTAAPGIRAGCLLAVARVAGETAPLLFTAYSSGFWNESLLDPTASLPVQIFAYTLSPHDDRQAQAWAAALVLLTMVFVLHLLARRALPRPHLDGRPPRSVPR